MVRWYVKRITTGKMTLEEVPAKWRKEVEIIMLEARHGTMVSDITCHI